MPIRRCSSGKPGSRDGAVHPDGDASRCPRGWSASTTRDYCEAIDLTQIEAVSANWHFLAARSAGREMQHHAESSVRGSRMAARTANEALAAWSLEGTAAVDAARGTGWRRDAARGGGGAGPRSPPGSDQPPTPVPALPTPRSPRYPSARRGGRGALGVVVVEASGTRLLDVLQGPLALPASPIREI